jgi:hypothetical protein
MSIYISKVKYTILMRMKQCQKNKVPNGWEIRVHLKRLAPCHKRHGAQVEFGHQKLLRRAV